MKMGLIGCGALGGYYGALLSRAGWEVHALLRTDYDVVQSAGWQIVSPHGDFRAYPHAYQTPEAIGACDLVIVALKTTAQEALAHLLPPLLKDTTRVLTLQNGLGNEDALERFLPSQRIMGGLCFVCLNRTSSGVIHHMDHGLIVMGEHRRAPDEETHALASIFQQAGIPCRVTDDLHRAHWEKLMWNVPFNGLGVAGVLGPACLESSCRSLAGLSHGACLDANALLDDPVWARYVRLLMGEIAEGAQALGFPLESGLAEQLIAKTRTMGPYKASTLIDFERGLPLEVDSLFRIPLREGEASGAQMPTLRRVVEILDHLDPRQNT